MLQNQADALDCRQAVFLDVMQRAVRTEVKDWPALLNWLTVRRALDVLRKRSHQLVIESHSQEIRQPATSSDVDWAELIELIRTELLQFPVRHAEVFWLHCVEDVSLIEIALQMNLPNSTVRVYLHRAKERLREIMAAKYPDLVPM